MNLDIREGREVKERGAEARLYSVLSEGGRLLPQQPDESKPLGKAAQKRLRSFPFWLGA